VLFLVLVIVNLLDSIDNIIILPMFLEVKARICTEWLSLQRIFFEGAEAPTKTSINFAFIDL